MNWNALGIQQRYMVNITQLGATKLVHGLFLNCVVFENNREKNIGVGKWLLYCRSCDGLFCRCVHGI